MQKKLILCSSITYAIKGRDILSRKGYLAYITRAPANDKDYGCGYCLSVNTKDLEKVIDILHENGVKVRHIIDFDIKDGGNDDDLS